ncbi:hypothetical protein [Bradyrhizobium sp. MOS002]|uniref:hypothetical protein n=1 Tax=Bradyrhizobium sp. MOS002 TaxID=2133947 RepID=UPI001304D852|nr:hypothetical protein [Bradyrhizobium sp. MOS002]
MATIQPSPMDWAAWRARTKQKQTTSALVASGVDLDGLSRLQRERMEGKARKGTLRAV